MRTVVEIDGMRARFAIQAVETALATLHGIEQAEVGLGRVILEHSGALDDAAITQAIELAGFKVRRIRVERRLKIVDR